MSAPLKWLSPISKYSTVKFPDTSFKILGILSACSGQGIVPQKWSASKNWTWGATCPSPTMVSSSSFQFPVCQLLIASLQYAAVLNIDIEYPQMSAVAFSRMVWLVFAHGLRGYAYRSGFRVWSDTGCWKGLKIQTRRTRYSLLNCRFPDSDFEIPQVTSKYTKKLSN
jgi:hypothetical protein